MKNQRKIYLISAKINDQIFYKIGYTKRDVDQRISEFKTGNCSEFDIVHIYKPNDYPVTIERALHKHFNEKKIDGEWFELNEDDIENFPDLCESMYEKYNDLCNNNTYLQDNNIQFK